MRTIVVPEKRPGVWRLSSLLISARRRFRSNAGGKVARKVLHSEFYFIKVTIYETMDESYLEVEALIRIQAIL